MRKSVSIVVSLVWIVCAGYPTRSNVGANHIYYCPQEEQQAYTASDYVQEGLVSQWDGIENAGYGIHDGLATTWIDLVGGVPMKNVRFGDDHAIPTGNTMTDSRPGYYPFYANGDFTLHGCLVNCPRAWYNWTEIGIGTGAGIENGICLSARDGSVNYHVCYRAAYSGAVLAAAGTGTVVGEKYSVDVVFRYSDKTYLVYVNGVMTDSATISESDWNLDGKALSVGIGLFHNLNGMGDFKVFDFMLYDRMLSDDEIAFNHEIDLQRFKN